MGPVQQPLALHSTIGLAFGVLTGIGASLLTYLAQRPRPSSAIDASSEAGILSFHTTIN
ncbi:hypothetical protein [Streptomyces chartreusis]|uniref:Uncharacterized protein n=1 Tax=Streptomyces chartreusis TaxID=1969 RepID=A0A7H8TAQ9_STRCX|nr:hypothetical protein [Streptomyces chartreusis]QKZ19080.1 hypothetical protein HUT05_17910 [Streptomyces chartreusis]